MGWLCFTGWQGAICAVCFLTGTVIQGLIILNNESYVPRAWHGSLLIIAIASFSVIFNTVLAKRLPLVACGSLTARFTCPGNDRYCGRTVRTGAYSERQ